MARFRLRTVLIIVSLAGMLAAYMGYRVRLASHQRQVASQIRVLGGEVIYEHDERMRQLPGYVPLQSSWRSLESRMQLPQLLGHDFTWRIVGVRLPDRETANTDWRFLGKLTDLRYFVAPHDPNFGDAEVSLLSASPQISHLDLSSTGVTDDGVAMLATRTNLKWLALNNTKITDKSVDLICNMDGLDIFLIKNTDISDVGEAVAVANLLSRASSAKRTSTADGEAQDADSRSAPDSEDSAESVEVRRMLSEMENESMEAHKSLLQTIDLARTALREKGDQLTDQDKARITEFIEEGEARLARMRAQHAMGIAEIERRLKAAERRQSDH